MNTVGQSESKNTEECAQDPLFAVLAGGLILCVFPFVELAFYQCAFMPDHIYLGWSTTLAALRTVPGCIAIGSSTLLAIVLWHQRWEKDGSGKAMQLVAAGCTACIGWAYSTHDFNYLYGEYHYADRIALVLLAFGVYHRPVLLVPFCVLASIALGQFDYPLVYSWTDKLPIVQTLYLAAFFQLLRRFLKTPHSSILLNATLILWAAFYFMPGIGKVQLAWLSSNNSGNIVYGAAIQNGWLAWLGWQPVNQIAAFANEWGAPLKLMVMCIELGAPLILFRRRIAVLFFASAIAMHVGIFALSGICFWKWVVLDIVFIVVLIRWVPDSYFSLRTGMCGIVFSVAFILISERDVSLAWLDSPVVPAFRMTAYDESGEPHLLLPREFAPFDIPFSQGRFFFLTETPQLVDCFGAVASKETVAALTAAVASRSDVSLLREKYGIRRSSPKKEERFSRFLTQFINAHNAGRTGGSFLSPPYHIRSDQPFTTDLPLVTKTTQISRIEVHLHEFTVTKSGYKKIHSELVHSTAHVAQATQPSDGL